MAYVNWIVLHLSLLLFVAFSLGQKCPLECKCSMKKIKGSPDKLKVDCRGRGITEIYPQKEFPKDMEILDLSRNNISIVRTGFLDQHDKLERLYLQKNSIKVLEDRAFVGLDELVRLNLRQNKLSQLKKATFLGLTNLDFLDLTSNKIRSIDKLAFHGLNSLTKLILKNNSFKSITNGTFHEFTSMKKIDMTNVPLKCDCSLNPFMVYLAKTGAPKALGKCRETKERLMDLKGIDLCEKPSAMAIDPSGDQIVSVGDRWVITCDITTKRSLLLYWTKNGNVLPRHVKVTNVSKTEMKSFSMHFNSISWKDAGTYRCNGIRLTSKQIVIKVVSSESKMCPRDWMRVGHDHLLWPMTIAKRTTVVLPCPWPSRNHVNVDTNIERICNDNGVWGPVKFGNCQLASLSKKLILLAELLKGTDFVDVTSVSEKLKLLTYPSAFQTAENISLVFDVIAGIIRKNVPFKGKLLADMLESFNNIMDFDRGTLYAAQRRDQTPSRIAAHLELISRAMVNETSTRVLTNFVIGSVELTQASSQMNTTCYVFFDSDHYLQAGGVYCGQSGRKGYSVSIQIPSTIFQSLQASGHNMDSLRLQFLVYRNAKLFPNVISNKTDAIMRGRNISSSVLGIQMENIEELNLTDPLEIRFATQPGTEPIISHFDFSEEGRPWSLNADCMVKDSTAFITTVECVRLVNKNLAVMSHLGITNVVVYPMEIVVYLGAVITSLLLIATLITFAFARSVRFNHDDIIMLMNACLALFVVVLSFAFGVDRTENTIVCRAMGMSLHFFFFASLLWLGSYVVCVTRRLMPRKETSEEVFNPVLMYYMISWGVPAVVCGMTVAGDIKNYKATDYCWLTESAGLGAFVGPACLLFIINAVLLVRLHLLLARGITDQTPGPENTEEERLQTTDEPGVLEEAPDPSERTNTEKSAITLYLVATWVVMSLIFLNFILAYFLINSRTSKLRWIFLSYVYALANIALGGAIFGFHCVARPEVREAWRQLWKRFQAWKISFGARRILFLQRRKDPPQMNGRILVNGEDITHRVESDRQSNITLPSSAALTNDVFVNGRPMSTARVSLLDEADFPPEESTHGGPVENEVDITETGNNEENRRSQNSVYSERKGKNRTESTSVPEENEESNKLLPIPIEAHEDSHADVTDGVTSKSESSAPTAVEVPQTSARADSPTVEYPRTVPHAGMTRPFNGNIRQQFPPANQLLHPSQVLPAHQFRPVFQAPFTHQIMPAHLVPTGQPAHLIPPPSQAPSGSPGAQQVPGAHQIQPVLSEPPPPSYQSVMDRTSQSGSSVGENVVLPRSNSKRKRSVESLCSRNESGSIGPRARKLPYQANCYPSSSSAISEIPGPDLPTSRPCESTNARNAAQNLGASASNSRAANRYRDGRMKPEPKLWNECTQNRIAYVSVPHVSKIHREPVHNETSV